MNTEDVINKLRALKLEYIKGTVGANPAALPNHFQEFLGYATLLYDHYGEVIGRYERKETEILQEEGNRRADENASGGKVTVAEMEQRIGIRLGTLKAEKKRLEQIVKGATIHINGCQSLMKNWGDEAKGIR